MIESLASGTGPSLTILLLEHHRKCDEFVFHTCHTHTPIEPDPNPAASSTTPHAHGGSRQTLQTPTQKRSLPMPPAGSMTHDA